MTFDHPEKLKKVKKGLCRLKLFYNKNTYNLKTLRNITFISQHFKGEWHLHLSTMTVLGCVYYATWWQDLNVTRNNRYRFVCIELFFLGLVQLLGTTIILLC